jgi:threonine synthase
MGLGLSLAFAEQAKLPWAANAEGEWRYAIASCGNAALAAAVVARAVERSLDVFIPTNASPVVVKRLEELGARITVCERQPGVVGDPCVLRFREEVARGAVPFCCQGNENGLAIDGGMTLAYEMISALRARGETLDRLFVQVGGGALASACAQAISDAKGMGVIAKMPRIHAVQAEGCAPLARAHGLVAGLAGTRVEAIPSALHYAATHRADFMWPWETEPKSLAHGILDDETYDWLAVVQGMLESGGGAIVVSENDVQEANRLARGATGINVDCTGSAGLAGLVALSRRGDMGNGERVAVIFSGVEREGGVK